MKAYGGMEVQPQLEVRDKSKNNFEDSSLLRYDATSVGEMILAPSPSGTNSPGHNVMRQKT
jgi:hypothetical protein